MRKKEEDYEYEKDNGRDAGLQRQRTGNGEDAGAGEGEEAKKQYHLELIRPKNYFYGENKDIFGNPLEEFIKVK